MLKLSMRQAFSGVLMGALGMVMPAMAGQDDFSQPIEMQYEFQNLDVKNKTSIIRGNVHIRQGSLNIYADQVEIDATGGEGNEVFTAIGERASYEQQLEDGSKIQAFARTIEYQRKSRILSLTGEAEVKQASSQFYGESIVFNMELEQLTAQGSDENEGRVTTIFKPQSLRKQANRDEDGTQKPQDDDSQQKDEQP